MYPQWLNPLLRTPIPGAAPGAAPSIFPPSISPEQWIKYCQAFQMQAQQAQQQQMLIMAALWQVRFSLSKPWKGPTGEE